MAIESSNEPGAFRQFEHRGWEAISEGYEQHFARLTSQAISATLDGAAVGERMRVLDVCTGPGMLAAAAAARGARVVALDFSARVLEVARRNVPEAEFREGDAQALPFDDDTFDAVVCGFGVIHVPEPAKALGEIRRVLKSARRAAVSVWEAPRADNGFGLVYGAIRAHGNLAVPLPHGPDFFQFSDEERLTKALAETGFGDVTVRGVEQAWEFDGPLGLVAALMEGAVRARGLLEAQSEAARASIIEAIESGMRQHVRSDGRYRVPMPALVGVGTK